MSRSEFAESVLQMTTTSDVAASIAGDLVQEANTRGTFWFWTSLFRTASALAYRTFTAAPFRLAGRAIVGSIVQYLNAVLLYLLLLAFQCWLAIVTGTTVDQAFLPRYVPSHPLAVITSILSSLGAAYLFGRWLVRKVPNRELPVYLMTWAVSQAVWLLTIRNEPSTITVYGPAGDLIMGVLTTVGGTIFTIAGIERSRRQGKLPGRIKRSLIRIDEFLLRHGVDLCGSCDRPTDNIGGIRILFGRRRPLDHHKFRR